LIITSCSTKKNTFLGRKYHAMTTKYNVLYNGNIALDQGIKGLADQYKDDYWKILPIEPLHIDEEKPIPIPGFKENEENSQENENNNKSKTPFEIAEEKAVKAIQKHGMYIDGVEYNKQTDAAYLLLGKSRYYSQRFVPALEAFDFLLKNFQNDNLSNELRIWKAKTQIRLQNEDRAVKTLRNLLSYKDIKGKTKENAHTALAMAYLAIDSTKLAIDQLYFATETSFDKQQHPRNLFVLGQLLRKRGAIDSSQVAFKKILRYRKSPQKFKMHAYIEQAKNITDSTDYKELQKQYKELIKVYENKNYLGELYYQLALMDFRDGNDSIALSNLSKSIQAPAIEPYQLSLSYEKAGDYYFDKSKFVTAGAYYDSLLAAVDNDNTKRVRKLRRKRESLDELIGFEKLIRENDSILSFVAMSETDRRAYFEKYVLKLKKADEEAAIQKENEERALSGGVGGVGGIGVNTSNNNGKWYFYNRQTVDFGRANFQKIWGNRLLKDNWRLSGETNLAGTDFSSGTIDINSTSTDDTKINTKKYDIDYYLSLIPKDEKVINQMREDNSEALYQLGLIYKEKFKEYSLATERLQRFLNENPKEKHILPAKYHLYKIYEITGNTELATIKDDIIAEYPNSRFAKMIINPEEANQSTEKKDSEKHYERVYCDYEFENYDSVLKQCNEAIKKYENDPIQAKFELLKSYAIFKLDGKKPFMTNLEYVTANFPKTEEAEHAQDMLDFLNGVKKPKKQKPAKIQLNKGKFGVKNASRKNFPAGKSKSRSNSRKGKSSRKPGNKTGRPSRKSNKANMGRENNNNNGSSISKDSPSLKG
jgi:tetratricopeptide (TPR) repeat protein